MWALTLSLALAQSEPSAAVLDALAAEQRRAAEQLRLPDAAAPYHVRTKVMWAGQVEVIAQMGAVTWTNTTPYRGVGVELRVGDPSFDNTGFTGWNDGFVGTGIGVSPTPLSAARDAWRIYDRAYKGAVEQLSRKEAQAVLPPDHPGDYTLTGPVTATAAAATPADPAALTRLAERLSAVFTAWPQLDVGEVHLGHEAGITWILDTEGTRVSRPIHETTIRAVAHVVTADGARIADQRLWTARDPSALPPEAAMAAELRAMVERLLEIAAAEPLEEEYVGPVVLEGAAAAALFRYVLLPQLEGTPQELPFDTFIGELGGGGASVRMGRRVLPTGWAVVDDPQSVPDHPGSYTHDAEGTPTRAITLVEDGIVRTLAMSRTPRKGLTATNGHGVATLSDRAIGAASLTTVTPDRALSDKALLKAAWREAQAYGHDYVVIVRRLQDPSTRTVGDPEWWMSLDDGPALPPPVEVVRRYADGREVLLRGAQFAAVERQILRDVVAAGRPYIWDFLAARDHDDVSLEPTAGRASRLVVPSVLIGELEMVPQTGDPQAARVVPPPG